MPASISPETTSTKRRVFSNPPQKKRATTLVDDQPRDVKRANNWTGGRRPWTEEEKAALMDGVEKHGLDFDRIKAESVNRLGKRSAGALEEHLRRHHPDKLKGPKEPRCIAWTAKEDAALNSGTPKLGKDWEKILETENEILGDRTVRAIGSRFHRMQKRRERERERDE